MAKSGAARVFFDIVGRFQAERLLGDSKSAMVVQQAILMDALGGVNDAFAETTQLILGGVGELVDAFFTYEEQFVRVRKFYQGSIEETREFAKAAVEMGEAFAFTGAEALAASARTAQLKGVLKSQLAIIEATRQGLLLAQIGEMETEIGMNRFINLAQQTGFMYGGLTKAKYESLEAEQQANIVRRASIHTLNQLNTVENSSVATMEDITFVLNQFAAQADIAGESIGEMAAMSALLLETGEEVSRAGTGLRMIYQRLGNANNNATVAIAELIEGMDAQGVAQMKLTDVIRDIAPAYNEMDSAQKRALAVNVAGSRHYIKFLKIMENQTRLTELQADAFNSLYPAIEEFENKTESAVFQSQQMEATLENMKVLLGEDLTEAYMTAYRAEAFFLDRTEQILNLPGIDTLVGSMIGLSNAYQKVLSPMAEMGLSMMNMFVALRTINILTAKNMAATSLRTKLIANENMMIKYNLDLTKILGDQTDILSVKRNKAQASYIGIANAQVRAARSKHQYLLGIRKEKIATVELALLNLKTGESAKLKGKALSTLKYKLSAATKGQDKHNSSIMRAMGLINIKKVAMAEEVALGRVMSAQFSSRLIMEARSHQAAAAGMAIQQGRNDTILQESALMGNEIVLYGRLSTTILANLELRSVEIRQTQLALKARIAALEARKAELLSKKLDITATQQKIALVQAEIMVLGEERVAIDGSTQAHHRYVLAEEKAIATTMTLRATVKAAGAAFVEQGMAIKVVQGSLMGMMMILPMVVDAEDQMAAMAYTMSLMILIHAVPALWTATASMAQFGAVTALATGGISILVAGLAVLTAYAGFQLFKDSFLGDMLKTDIDYVQTLNGELDRTTAILSELQEGGGKAPVNQFMFGDLQYDDLKQNELLTDQTLLTIKEKIKQLEIDKIRAIEEGNIEMEAGLENSINLLEMARKKVLAIDDAQKVVAATDLADNMPTDIQMKEIGYGSMFGDESLPVLLGYNNKEWAVFWETEGEVMSKTFGKGAAGKGKAATWMESLTESFSDDNMAFTKDHYANLLMVQDDFANDFIDTETEMFNAITNKQHEFANAREELFFGGNASNFTGAIMKTVTQGGVESLLHKTEIIQTNVFHGYNTEEMVQRVTAGVLEELRSSTGIGYGGGTI